MIELQIKNRSESDLQLKQLQRKPRKKKSEASTGFEPMASAKPVRCMVSVEHRTGIAEVMGSNPRSLSILLLVLLSCRQYRRGSR